MQFLASWPTSKDRASHGLIPQVVGQVLDVVPVLAQAPLNALAYDFFRFLQRPY